MSSENHYRLDLTERELIDVLDALVAWADPGRPWIVRLFLGRGEIDRRIYDLYQKVGTLEPIGTGGTTTTEGA